jgi:RNA polymerase subunit RPABC4/transcription elongation factor Spt4
MINFVYSIKELQLQCATLQGTANKTAAMCATESVANTWSGILMMLIETIKVSHCVTKSQ